MGSKKYNKNRHSLAFILFWWFISLPVVPLLILGFSEYYLDKKSTINNRYEQIKAMNFLLTQRANDFFEIVLTNMYINAEESTKMIDDIEKAAEIQGYDLQQILNSDYYTQITTAYSHVYINLLRLYNYKDIIVGDKYGNILYSVNSQDYIGKSLFSTQNSTPKLSTAIADAISSHMPKYVDLVYYFGKLVNFYILPLIKTDNSVAGFLAVQLNSSNIEDIFFQGQNLDQKTYSYLVNQEGLVAYKNIDTQDQYDNNIKFSPAFITWKNNLQVNSNYSEDDIDLSILEDASLDDLDTSLDQTLPTVTPEKNIEKVAVYENHFNQKVIGYNLDIDISGNKQLLISEVLLDDALVSALQFRNRLIIILGVTCILLFILALFISRRLVKPIKIINTWVNKVASGDYVAGEVLEGSIEITELSSSFNDMSAKLRDISARNEERTWHQEGVSGLNNSVRGELEIEYLAEKVIRYLCDYLGIHCGAIYILQENNILQLIATFAWSNRKQTKNQFELGEGLIGQVGLEKKPIKLTQIPEDFIDIESGMGISKPSEVMIMPLLYDEQLKGVIELATLNNISKRMDKFISTAISSIAIAINSAQYRTRVHNLLETTTNQSARLKQQQKDLQSANQKLEDRAHVLEESENKLKAQSNALQKSNIKLEEKSKELMLQKKEIEKKNADIEFSNKKILEKAKELELASKYKSEFLANMSHELRTPLNSMLLLAKMLCDNETENLTQDQVDSVKVIFNSGNDLLSLINDILDLSKVEAGKLSINLDQENINEIFDNLKALFTPLAQSKNLTFSVNIADNVPENIVTDRQRILQILKNFLSNAFKFTAEGGVSLDVNLLADNKQLEIRVSDTGIGIPKDKQSTIFESFQQADGSTSRKYGGTGLGLSISVKLANLLGGTIKLESEENKGTTFILFIPNDSKVPEKQTSENSLPSENIISLNNNSKKTTIAKPAKPAKLTKPQDTKIDASKTNVLLGKQIIIVDNNLRNSFTISGVLEDCKAEVTILDSEEKISDATKNQNIDIVIVSYAKDQQLDLNQLERILEQLNERNILFIIATASNNIKQQLDNRNIKLINYPIKIEDIIQISQK